MSTYTDKPCHITGVAVGELALDVNEGKGLLVKAAFVDEHGNTHGWTSCATWSAETIEKLDELIKNVELDLLNRHFEKEEEENHGSTQGTEDRGRGPDQL